MKKIILFLVFILNLFSLNLIYANNYTVIDNTNDGIHNSLAPMLIEIGSNYLN
jgi:hypothetical protein